MEFEKYHVAVKMYVIPMEDITPTELIDFFKEVSRTDNTSLEIWNDKYCIFL